MYSVQKAKKNGRLFGRSRVLTIAVVILAFGLLLLLINLYELRLMQYDHTIMHGAVVEGQADRSSDGKLHPIVWIQGRNQHTGYLRHVHAVFNRLGYTEGGAESDWDVLWAHDYPFVKLKEHVVNMKPHKKVNHFPGSGFLTNKVSLATSNLTHVPKAFKMPASIEEFKTYAKTHPNKLWVQKGNNHRGVKIRKVEELDLSKNESFVQEYVGNPMLVDGRRFDIGIYTTMTSVDPLRVYVYDGDWLIRFCNHDYYPFIPTDLNKYVITDDYTQPWQIPSLKKLYSTLDYSRKESLLAYIRQQGKDPNLLIKNLHAALRDVYLKKEQALINSLSKYPSKRQFFEMVRVDFVVDANMDVYLLEVNMSPNLSSGMFPQNRLLYEQVVYGMLGLVGVAHSTTNTFTKGSSDEQEMHVSSKDTRVYSDECASSICFDNCRTQECKLCSDCLKAEQQLTLQDAYLEHTGRTTWRRVIPRSFKNSEEAMYWDFEKDSEFKGLTANNKMMLMWFRGKCLQDVTWCA